MKVGHIEAPSPLHPSHAARSSRVTNHGQATRTPRGCASTQVRSYGYPLRLTEQRGGPRSARHRPHYRPRHQVPLRL